MGSEAAAGSSPLLGTVVVTGGCGFLGFHLVRALLDDPECGQVYAISRNPTVNTQEGAIYRSVDLLNADALEALFAEIKPRTVFHAASPRSADLSTPSSVFLTTNIQGTENILHASQRAGSVRALVYTSTVGVIAGVPHVRMSETAATWQPKARARPYYLSKTRADDMIRAASTPELATACMRVCLMYGERDSQFVPGVIEAVLKNKTGVQLGDNTADFDMLYAPNAAAGHLLAAKALLDPSRANGPVAGEAFNLTDGAPTHLWDAMRIVWRAAGDKRDPKSVTIIPRWAAMAMAEVAEVGFKIFTLGQRQPQELNKLVVEHCVMEHTYDIEKARRVLGYKPVPSLEKGLTLAAEWELKARGKGNVNGAEK